MIELVVFNTKIDNNKVFLPKYKILTCVYVVQCRYLTEIQIQDGTKKLSRREKRKKAHVHIEKK